VNSGLFIKLDVAFYEDAAILEVSDAAELLFVRAICLAKRIGSDGYLSLKQLGRIAPDIGTDIGTDIGSDSVTDIASELVDVGLLIRTSKGFQIASFLKHNSTMKTVQSQRQGGEYGNHLK
jgi:hypothetical protein